MPYKKIPPLYYTWRSMINRCHNPNCPQYADYGGRGITVCKRWRKSFAAFVADIGPRPGGFLIERIHNNRGYSPNNCKWATRAEQMLNRRNTLFVTVEGRKYKAHKLAQIACVKTDTIVERAASGLPYLEVVSKVKKNLLHEHHQRTREKKTCKKGHPFDEKNTLITKEGWRSCRRCHADRQFMRTHR